MVDDAVGNFHSAFLYRISHLVSDGIHDDGRMVEVLLDDGYNIVMVIVHEPVAVVVLVLGSEPHVPKFIHDVHSEFVTCLEKFLGAGLVRTSYGIEAEFLQDGYLPVFGILP